MYVPPDGEEPRPPDARLVPTPPARYRIVWVVAIAAAALLVTLVWYANRSSGSGSQPSAAPVSSTTSPFPESGAAATAACNSLTAAVQARDAAGIRYWCIRCPAC